VCGINIIFHIDEQQVDRNVIERMNRVLHHRGPDAQGIECMGHVGLGHTRLSIVDVDGGVQPFTTSDGRYTITYNGEIYNYEELRDSLSQQGVTFKTHCDTEIVVEMYRAHGADCVNHLRGMFAFAIYDRENAGLFVARDRFGIKPLFYFANKNYIVLSSEIKAILATEMVVPQLDYSVIVDFFSYQFSMAPHTPFKDVLELPPGHYLEISKSQFAITQYWDVEFPDDGDYETNDESYWLREFETALNNAVDSHTIGDVPIGAYLSGGIDSSAIAMLLQNRYSESLQTFSIHLTNPASDESSTYRPVAENLKLPNSELVIDDTKTGGFLDTLINCIYHLEQPQRMAVDIPHFLLSNHVREAGYKVVYTGDGADEILAGYDCFRQNQIRVWGNDFTDPIERETYYLSEFGQYFSESQLLFLLGLHEPNNQQRIQSKFGFYPVWYDFWQTLSALTDQVLTDEAKLIRNQDSHMNRLAGSMKEKIKNIHPINQSLYLESKTRLPGWILWKSDRLSMANGVEARIPFLDHPLAELSARIPPDLKLNGMDEKYILKKVTCPHLPPLPDNYKKRGFYTPIKEWLFTASTTAQLDDYLDSAALKKAGIFNAEVVKRFRDELVALPTPNDMESYYHSMKLEWMLMLVLTTQIMHDLFIEKTAPCFQHN